MQNDKFTLFEDLLLKIRILIEYRLPKYSTLLRPT